MEDVEEEEDFDFDYDDDFEDWFYMKFNFIVKMPIRLKYFVLFDIFNGISSFINSFWIYQVDT